MRDKKKAGPEKTPELQALERHVDAMMDPNQPDEVPAESTPAPVAKKPAAKAAETVKAAETAKSVKTAPELSAKLRKQIAISDENDKLKKELASAQAESESASEPEVPAEPETPEEPEAPETEIPESTDDAEPAAEDDIAEQSMDLDDVRIDEAVDDIVAHEGDVMLAVEDATAAERNRQVAAIPSQKGGHRAFSTIMWTLVFLMVIVAVAFFGFLFTGGNLPNLPGL